MANKDRNKRAAREARRDERARVEAAQSEAAGGNAVVATKPAEKKPEKKADASKKPGAFKRFKGYLRDVKTEMSRVSWPSTDELRNYSVAVIIMLVVFGVVIWAVDSGVVQLLVLYTGLRG